MEREGGRVKVKTPKTGTRIPREAIRMSGLLSDSVNRLEKILHDNKYTRIFTARGLSERVERRNERRD